MATVISSHALRFRGPAGEVAHLQASVTPQPIPDWVFDNHHFKAAQTSGWVTAVQLPAAEAAEPEALGSIPGSLALISHVAAPGISNDVRGLIGPLATIRDSVVKLRQVLPQKTLRTSVKSIDSLSAGLAAHATNLIRIAALKEPSEKTT